MPSALKANTARSCPWPWLQPTEGYQAWLSLAGKEV